MTTEVNTQTEDTTANQSGDTSTGIEGEPLFTQEEVNKFVSKRAKEIKAQFKDYEELKGQVTTLTEQLKVFQDQAKELKSKYNQTVFDSILKDASVDLGLDVEIASKFIEKDKLIVVDERPTNIKELLQAVIEKHPQLIKKIAVTPEVPTNPEPNKPAFSLHNTPNTSKFFNGSGLRLGHLNTKE